MMERTPQMQQRMIMQAYRQHRSRLQAIRSHHNHKQATRKDQLNHTQLIPKLNEERNGQEPQYRSEQKRSRTARKEGSERRELTAKT